MELELSKDAIDFFLDVEIAVKSDVEENSDYHFQPLVFATNEYTLNVFLKYKKHFIREAVYSDIEKVLNEIGHPSNDEIVSGLILLFCLTKKEIRNHGLLIVFFSLIQSCKLKQYMFFNGRQQEKVYTLKFNDFTIGNIDYYKFSDFIRNHSTSDFARRYENSLLNKAGVEIKYYEIKIIDFYKWKYLLSNGDLRLNELQTDIINSYLTTVSNFYFTVFKKNFFKQQEFINAFFGIYYPLELLEMFGYDLVNIFYDLFNNTNNGWVLPISGGIASIAFPDPRIIADVNSFLAKNKNEIYESKGEYSRYMDTVCSIFSYAERHLTNGSHNNAYIDFFVGLDFLLAPDTEKSKKLKQRISLLTYKAMSNSFNEQLERLNYLYDVRSNYVHNGVMVKEEDLIEIRNIARVILSILLQVHKQNFERSRLKFTEWLSKIDEFVQDFYKGKSPNEQQLSLIGVKGQKAILQNSLNKYTFQDDSGES